MASDLDCLRNFYLNIWRHYKVNRMTSKAKRVVTDLFDLFMSETNIAMIGSSAQTLG